MKSQLRATTALVTPSHHISWTWTQWTQYVCNGVTTPNLSVWQISASALHLLFWKYTSKLIAVATLWPWTEPLGVAVTFYGRKQEIPTSNLGYGMWWVFFLWFLSGRPGFDSLQRQDFSVLHGVQIGSGTHPASYPMGTGRYSLRRKSGQDVKLTTHLHLMPKSRMGELYLYSPICVRCVVLN
jgi:hypothetical protein